MVVISEKDRSYGLPSYITYTVRLSDPRLSSKGSLSTMLTITSRVTDQSFTIPVTMIYVSDRTMSMKCKFLFCIHNSYWNKSVFLTPSIVILRARMAQVSSARLCVVFRNAGLHKDFPSGVKRFKQSMPILILMRDQKASDAAIASLHSYYSPVWFPKLMNLRSNQM